MLYLYALILFPLSLLNAFLIHPGFLVLTALSALIVAGCMLRDVFALFSDYDDLARRRRR